LDWIFIFNTLIKIAMNKIQKNIKNQKPVRNRVKVSKIVNCLAVILFVAGCSDFLDVKPTNLITVDAVFASEEGIEAFLAHMYHDMPIEDFNYFPTHGFNYNPGDNLTSGGMYEWVKTDDAIHPEYDDFTRAGNWWGALYTYNKDVNLFFSYIPTIMVITEETRERLYGEAYFLRAITYFTLARRYGGVPIITSIAELTDTVALLKPRNTEKETWDFALANCDSAAMFLGDDVDNKHRLNKWTALALKSRIALHAASVAKYWDKAFLSGRAVDEKLVGGMTQEDAQNYYDQCIDASKQIMNSGMFSLFKPAPANPAEAAENYRLMFEKPNNAPEEVIFVKGHVLVGQYGSNQDNWCGPHQTRGSYPYGGSVDPTIDLIDTYESYSNPGHSSPVQTRTDGNTDDYNGYDPSKTYLTFDDPLDIFKDKDARMHGSIILPNSMWKNTQIVIQGGYIRPDGTYLILGDESIEVDGVTYYTYGASSPNLYSGFSSLGRNYTRSGFLLRKFMDPTLTLGVPYWGSSTTDWIAFRYAEVLLNYAEAVVESGHDNAVEAAKAINDLRKRAGHQSDIPLNIENVLRERRVELVFENTRLWDLVRRRDFHIKFNYTWRNALIPVLDLRTISASSPNPKYIFVRSHAPRTGPKLFVESEYYYGIPGIGVNKLIQNPQY